MWQKSSRFFLLTLIRILTKIKSESVWNLHCRCALYQINGICPIFRTVGAVSEPHPIDWDQVNVVLIGVLSMIAK